MATYDVLAKTFDVQHDIDDAFSSAGWSITYERLTAAQVFDPFFFNDIEIYHGEASPDKVRIKVNVDGIESEIMLGVVDRNGWTDRQGGAVSGSMGGRDLMAFILDKTPTTGFTIAAGTKFRDAVEQIAELAGLSVSFFCDDYTISTPVPVTVDNTFGSVLQTLLTPFRWSEKHRVDAWVEGTILTIAERNYSAPPRGTVTINAERLVTNRMEKSRNVQVDDVKVDGARFRVVIISPDLDSAHTDESDETITSDDGKNIYTIHTEEEFDNKGRPIRKDIDKVWLLRVSQQFPAGGPTTRTEHTHDEYAYHDNVGQDVPFYSLLKSEESYHEVTDTWGPVSGKVGGPERISERVVQWDYYPDNGDAKSQEVSDVQRTEDGTKIPTSWNGTNTVTSIRWYRMGGQTTQVANGTEYQLGGVQSGAVKRSWRTTQVGAYKVPSASEGVAKSNEQVTEGQYSAGPTSYAMKLRREQSDMLDNAGCALVRGHLLDENTSTMVAASFRMPFDPRIKPGKLLAVQQAPSWWPVTSFYITAIRATAGEGLDSDIEALAWV